ncbi:kelch-like protein diablo isoform X1 [Saccostrea cucullata]|uniref:kelch-like protein diablo isoform X1 n=1 Tax=Saccostrea cuccullata TaxID=36930 RepID=UPI002ED268B5
MTSSQEVEKEINTDDSSADGQLDLEFPETDVTLLVEGRKIHVSKAVLSQHSPVFKAMFSGNFKESKQKEVPLHDKKFQDVVEFLRSFYPNMKHKLTEHNVLQVLPLAHEYQSSLVDDCEEFMVDMCKPGTNLTVTTLLDYIIAAEKYDLHTLMDVAMTFCAHVDYYLLNGNIITRDYDAVRRKYLYKQTTDTSISTKFKNIGLEHRHKIAELRVKFLEMYKRKRSSGDPITEDYSLMLSEKSDQE